MTHLGQIGTEVELIVGILVGVLVLAVIGRRIALALPLVFLIGGLAIGGAWSLIPGMPAIRLPPDLVFFVLLPPLLVSAAYDTPLAVFRANLSAITWLAVGLVLATMFVIALLARLVAPELPLAAAFVLGAIVSPPDSTAVTEMLGSVRLPNRLQTILQGEGLVNDATALSAYQIAVRAAITGAFSVGAAAVTFGKVAVIGTAVGIAVGWLMRRVLRAIDDAPLETIVTLIVPYLAYLAAEQLGGSPILSAAATGFLLRRRIHRVSSARTRLRLDAVWDTLVFTINGAVFVLIGFELGAIASSGIPGHYWIAAALISAATIAVRVAWMFTVPYLLRALRLERSRPLPSPPEMAVLSWSGMRGVISLAAALAVPLAVASGQPFPGRALIIFVTFAVIFSTLVVQGLTLPWLVRKLGVADPGAEKREEQQAREAARSAALAHLDALAPRYPPEVIRDIRGDYQAEAEAERAGEEEQLREAWISTLEAEREALERLRDEGAISNDTAERLEREIDLRAL